ncbi:hypothetical protein CAPTEDRAFT_200318 [Capitella teleta]|uniref:MULE transposase domain-containing protein n=1 Tax=Capitella teleta TaxID=283909 RepID=R7UTG9_CAPTE|nr:hypothetical protein CAPTEDRAFT_200318 [Capitella teleta]|eukprot:ELU09453.1 hypothetical protein CAPTEDRAFT_200318 [Capitella teleta]
MDFGEMALTRLVRESIRKDAGVEFDAHVVRQEREAFIADQLSSLSTSGHYVPRKITGPDYHYYQCERSRKKSGRSSGDPSKTRANSCTGFVSFKFSTHGQILLCTVKVRKSHTGHNISNVEEAKKNRLDSDMVAYMHMHFSAGKTNTETLTLSHHDGNDAISTAHLIASDLREEVQYHQPLHKEQGLTAYRFAVYVMSVRNSAGYGSPVASFVVSQETTEILTKCFTELQKRTPFIPRAVMVDKDLKLVESDQERLCRIFRVTVLVSRPTGGGGLTGQSNVVQRKAVIDFMRNLKAQATEADFNNAVEAACATIPAKVWKYLKVNWFAIATMWANFGRKYFHEGYETNNLSERWAHAFQTTFPAIKICSQRADGNRCHQSSHLVVKDRVHCSISL